MTTAQLLKNCLAQQAEQTNDTQVKLCHSHSDWQ
jgi:hypothetical protein